MKDIIDCSKLVDLLGVGVCGQSEGVVVRGERGGGAGVPGLGTRAQRRREVQPQVHGVAHLPIFLSVSANIFTAIYLLGGALWQLEEVLVVREDVVQGRVLLGRRLLARLPRRPGLVRHRLRGKQYLYPSCCSS